MLLERSKAENSRQNELIISLENEVQRLRSVFSSLANDGIVVPSLDLKMDLSLTQSPSPYKTPNGKQAATSEYDFYLALLSLQFSPSL